MAVLIIPSAAEVEFLTRLSVDLTWGARLYKNDYTPVDGTLLSDFVLADFAGYDGSRALAWGAVSHDGTKARVVSANFSWTCTGGSQILYGIVIANAGYDKMRGAQRFTAPITISSGETKTFSVEFTLNEDIPA